MKAYDPKYVYTQSGINIRLNGLTLLINIK
jgi:hypothetical protein